MLVELLRREKEAGIKPDPDTDIFLKVRYMSWQTSLGISWIHPGKKCYKRNPFCRQQLLKVKKPVSLQIMS